MNCPHCQKPIDQKIISQYMSENGKKGGSRSSEAKTKAARENILKRWEKDKLMKTTIKIGLFLTLLIPSSLYAKSKEVPICTKNRSFSRQTGIPICGNGCWLEGADKVLKQRYCSGALPVRKGY